MKTNGRLALWGKVLLGILAFVAWVYFLVFFVLTGYGTGFARACNSVETEMPREIVISIMGNYENKNGVEFSEKLSELNYVVVSENFFADTYQCLIFLDEQNNVRSVMDIFD